LLIPPICLVVRVVVVVVVSQLAKVGQTLASLIWHDAFISLENVILALMDRDDDPNAANIIDYLLLKDKSLLNRLCTFLHLQFKPNFWDEPDHFSKHQAYYAQHPLNPALAYSYVGPLGSANAGALTLMCCGDR
jgi:hypothetical protein